MLYSIIHASLQLIVATCSTLAFHFILSPHVDKNRSNIPIEWQTCSGIKQIPSYWRAALLWQPLENVSQMGEGKAAAPLVAPSHHTASCKPCMDDTKAATVAFAAPPPLYLCTHKRTGEQERKHAFSEADSEGRGRRGDGARGDSQGQSR